MDATIMLEKTISTLLRLREVPDALQLRSECAAALDQLGKVLTKPIDAHAARLQATKLRDITITTTTVDAERWLRWWRDVFAWRCESGATTSAA